MRRKLLSVAMAFMALTMNAQVWDGARLALNFNSSGNLASNDGNFNYTVNLGTGNVSSVSRFQEVGRGLRTTSNGVAGTTTEDVANTMIKVQGINGHIYQEGTISFTARYHGGVSGLTYRPFVIIPNGGVSYFEGLFLGVTSNNKIRFGGGRQQGQFNSQTTEFTIDNTTYHNYTLVFGNTGNSSVIKLFIDGELIHTLTNSFQLLFDTSQPMLIAGSNLAVAGASDLDIDHFYVWNQALASAAVLGLSEKTSDVNSIWHFDNSWDNVSNIFNMSNIVAERHNRFSADININNYVSPTSDKNGNYGNALRVTGNYAVYGNLPRFSVEKFSEVILLEEINQVGFSFDYHGNTMTSENSFGIDGIYPLAAMSYDQTSTFVIPGVIVGRNVETDMLELRMLLSDTTYLQQSAEVDWNEWNSIQCLMVAEDRVELKVNDEVVIEMEYPHGLPLTANSLFTMAYLGNEIGVGFTSGVYDEMRVFANKTEQGTFLVLGAQEEEEEEEEETVSLNELTNAKGYAVYPNPSASGVFTLQRLNDQVMNYEIVDVTGKVVVNGVMNKVVHTFNMSSVPSGIYFLKMANGEHYDIIKLIK